MKCKFLLIDEAFGRRLTLRSAADNAALSLPLLPAATEIPIFTCAHQRKSAFDSRVDGSPNNRYDSAMPKTSMTNATDNFAR
jgi:hypothetical protein